MAYKTEDVLAEILEEVRFIAKAKKKAKQMSDWHQTRTSMERWYPKSSKSTHFGEKLKAALTAKR